MGGVLSSLRENPKAQLAWTRLTGLSFSTASWVSSIVWVCATGFIVLGVPVFFQYEKECQMFDMHAQMMQAQQSQAAAMESS
eukprot:GDKH01012680.1.p1 GENE.GDKH01012680.1~~GDKH01012680.1.p1  ORF type:complete len:82 (+),score=21.00 GDKH01012680.1:173-418(+)